MKVEGLAGPIDFTRPDENPDVARVFAKGNYAYTIRDGAYTPLFGGKPVDVSAALK
ncbi:hypothetical protein [Streptomyces sp. UG1]|uniref:hypothetical protein n=1 Tax=Streptomyces sp. UG1 TaxID=3417652 RepID=UPI003CF01C2B